MFLKAGLKKARKASQFQNVNLFQIYQRFGLLFGVNWCKNQFYYQYKSKRHQYFTGVFFDIKYFINKYWLREYVYIEYQ